MVGFAEVFADTTRDFDHGQVLHGLAQVAAQALADAGAPGELERTVAANDHHDRGQPLEFSSSLDLQDTLVKVGAGACAPPSTCPTATSTWYATTARPTA